MEKSMDKQKRRDEHRRHSVESNLVEIIRAEGLSEISLHAILRDPKCPVLVRSYIMERFPQTMWSLVKWGEAVEGALNGTPLDALYPLGGGEIKVDVDTQGCPAFTIMVGIWSHGPAEDGYLWLHWNPLHHVQLTTTFKKKPPVLEPVEGAVSIRRVSYGVGKPEEKLLKEHAAAVLEVLEEVIRRIDKATNNALSRDLQIAFLGGEIKEALKSGVNRLLVSPHTSGWGGPPSPWVESHII